jgi:hypothetical protein
MGLFSDRFKMEYEGSVIEVEARSVNILMGVFRYALIINNRRVEDIEGSLGQFSLRGELDGTTSSHRKAIAVRIKQGFFGTKAFLEVDQQSLRMPRA